MEGGTGNDIYWVGEADDVVVELPGGGYDLVRASISYTLAANVEELQMLAAGTTGTGNDEANRIRGSANSDTIDGGAGNDTYVMDDAGDVVTEAPGADYDRVVASVSWTLGAEFERLSLSGTADLSGTGNALANRLDGNAGANLLDGGKGNDSLHALGGDDTLLGGANDDRLRGDSGDDSLVGRAGFDILLGGNEADLFLFSAIPLSVDAADIIIDFTVGLDRVGIIGAAFDASLGSGVLDPARFVASTTGQAVTAGLGTFGFETDNGRLWWDADGRGGEARELVAILRGGVTLGAADIFVF
jgi:Ca2+-binding RTX toxin-like protein